MMIWVHSWADPLRSRVALQPGRSLYQVSDYRISRTSYPSHYW